MPDRAQTDLDTPFQTLLAAHARNARFVEDPAARVVSLPSRSADVPAPNGLAERAYAAHQAAPDWSSAIQLIREATEAIRISEDRAAELEDHLAQFTEDVSEKIRRLNAEIGARDQKIAETEERVRAAEARADTAETWLRKLHDAIHASFSPLRRP